jgi:hypothetical protein
VVASLAALGSVIAASSCCLPLLPFLFAAGAAGTSAFVAQLRPYLLVLFNLIWKKDNSLPLLQKFVAQLQATRVSLRN